MALTSIEWTATVLSDGAVLPGYTFNPWWGCTKISPGCANCYAAAIDYRFHNEEHWGVGNPRRYFDDKHWLQPVKWNLKAARLGVRLKVFCASMADVFEIHPEASENAALNAARARLWKLVEATPMLDWLFLTKRVENVGRLVPHHWWRGPTQQDPAGGFPVNVWLGQTVCTQEEADEKIPLLRSIRVFRRFISYEPALERIDWWPHLTPCRCMVCGRRYEADPLDPEIDPATWSPPNECVTGSLCYRGGFEPQIHWLIGGGESGPRARPFEEDWMRETWHVCDQTGVKFFYKQRLENRKKVSLPLLDGVRHTDQPDSAQIV